MTTTCAPGFYRALERGFVNRPEIGAAFCRHILMDELGNWRVISPLERPESGVLAGWVDRLAVGQRPQPPSIAVRREVYERLGGFDPRIRQWSEDWEMWLRIAAHFPVWYEPEPLAAYRMRSGSLRRARRAIDSGHAPVALAQARAAARVSRSPAVVRALVHTSLRLAMRRVGTRA